MAKTELEKVPSLHQQSGKLTITTNLNLLSVETNTFLSTVGSGGDEGIYNTFIPVLSPITVSGK